MQFVSLFFLNEKNTTTFLVLMHLKCTVVHYSNLNSSSGNKPLFKLRAVEYAISFFFFRFLIYVSFNEAFAKKNYEVTIIFSFKFPKFISRCSILQNIKTSNPVILKWRHFQHKAKFEKKYLFS